MLTIPIPANAPGFIELPASVGELDRLVAAGFETVNGYLQKKEEAALQERG